MAIKFTSRRKNETDAIEFLQSRPKDKPFCLTVAFFAAHAEDGNPKQYLPQPQSMELYRDAVVPTPKTATEEHFRKLPPFIANDKNEGRNRWKWRFDTPDRYQEYMKNYYRLVSEVDSTCGRVIEELKQQGVYDSTLIVFTTDNGYFHAEHGLADKWYPYEESIRVPLIIRDPRSSGGVPGTVREELTLNVDLAPTLLSCAGLTPPSGMQGTDLSQLYLSSLPTAWRTDFYYEHATIRNVDFIPSSAALVSKEWKYIYWPDFEYEQLFDLHEDPLEENDVARSDAYAKQLAAMRSRFAELKSSAK